MVTSKEFLELLDSQQGDSYVFGVEVSMSDGNPSAFDCSELIEWGCGRLQIQPRMPDGSWNQLQHCHRHELLISVEEAINTPGALLFRFGGGDPFGTERPASAHVAVSHGDGSTIEARSRSYGVGKFGVWNRGWTHAARIPGIEYVVQKSDLQKSDLGVSIQVELNQISYHRRSRGAEVLTLQGLLHARGYAELVGKMDGVFGENTDRAVRQFQTARNLKHDGIVGAKTWKALITNQTSTE